MCGWDGGVSSENQQDSCRITYHINRYLGTETHTVRCIYMHTSVMNSPINRHSLFGAWPSYVLEANMVVLTLGCWDFARSAEAELMPVLPIGSLHCEGGVVGCPGSTLRGGTLCIAPLESLFQSRGCSWLWALLNKVKKMCLLQEKGSQLQAGMTWMMTAGSSWRPPGVITVLCLN